MFLIFIDLKEFNAAEKQIRFTYPSATLVVAFR